jgi:protein-S-isoprenylcysteine O-methyltransferase Ste14
MASMPRSLGPRSLVTTGNVIGMAALVSQLLGSDAAALRQGVLISCAAVYVLRMILAVFVIQRRAIGWLEGATVGTWMFVIHTFFGSIASRGDGPPTSWTLIGGGLLYVVGSAVSTVSELQRMQWSGLPEHRGKIYTGGLFRFAVHVNYTGDVLLFSGYAWLTGQPVTLAVPALMLLLFVTVHIPKMDRHLHEHYGRAFDEYAECTAKLVPYIY